MDLTDEQKQRVRQWAAEKATLGQIQQRLREDFGIALSYMDTRFLVGDLDVKLAEKPEPVAAATTANAITPASAAPAGKVSVAVNELTPPYALVSGTVTFSDGKRSDWHVDEMGRLALNPAEQGYQPTQQDLAEFQLQLRKLVQGGGS